MKFWSLLCLLIAGLFVSACQSKVDDNTALIAVATNFRTTFEKLTAVFESETDFNVTLVSGATGHLYTQIINGAPYHAFLSADIARPQALEMKGFASERFIYAEGVLVLWSRSRDVLDVSLADLLSDPDVTPIAIANPALAPYGQAAQDVFAAFDAKMDVRLVMGENVGQAFALVQSGNARAGFVALADAQRYEDGYYNGINPALYSPIKQEATLLSKGKNNSAAKAFLIFLRSPPAQAIILSDGYILENDAP